MTMLNNSSSLLPTSENKTLELLKDRDHIFVLDTEAYIQTTTRAHLWITSFTTKLAKKANEGKKERKKKL